MIDGKTQRAADDAVNWALMQGLAFKQAPHSAVHVPFSFTPEAISFNRFDLMGRTANALSRLVYAVSEDHDFVARAIQPVAKASPFFARLLELHNQTRHAPREPLLIMRSDFMDDAHHGPQLVETNGVAAGMGPFGQRAHEMHTYLKSNWQIPYRQWSKTPEAPLMENPAIDRIASAIAKAAFRVAATYKKNASPLFVMVTQADEDNVFDQHLLEHALQKRGVRTARRTLHELANNMYSGSGDRLMVRDLGSVESVYFRTGYAFSDYAVEDEVDCCLELMNARAFIEQHYVSINATVSQQLATSKRMQLLLSQMSTRELMQFGLEQEEAALVEQALPRMMSVTDDSILWLRNQDPAQWVLKNQGEGGGHCHFDQSILRHLQAIPKPERAAWLLMQRLYPESRGPVLVVSEGQPKVIDELVSEMGIFTVQSSNEVGEQDLYAGYLVRSKPAQAREGGVHTGQGVLSSLSGQSSE